MICTGRFDAPGGRKLKARLHGAVIAAEIGKLGGYLQAILAYKTRGAICVAVGRYGVAEEEPAAGGFQEARSVSEVDAHRTRIDAAQGRQIILRRLTSCRRNANAIEHAIVADVRHEAAVRRVDTRAENILPIIADRDVDDAILVGIVGLSLDHAVHALKGTAQALLILRQHMRVGDEFQRVGSRRIQDDGDLDGAVGMKVVEP